MLNKPTRHLYIHWPFCSSKCHYCDFVAFEQHEQFQEQYHQTLCTEIITFAQQFSLAHDRIIDTIFLGGGTPSLYPLPLITQLFDTIKKNYILDTAQEISIETNPADIDEERLEAWHDLGINRLSVGIQSLNDDVLLSLNRRQRNKDVLRTMRIAPKYFDNISADFILGLPGVTSEAWYNTIRQAVSWPISHISIYFLTVHEKTPLYFKVERGDIALERDEILVDLYEKTVEMLANEGFDQYEISNFARNGKQSIHNKAYWNRRPYRGFGVGASSFDGVFRSSNTNNLVSYLEFSSNPAAGAVSSFEKLTSEQALLELLMLSLRQKCGIDLHRVLYFLNTEQKQQFIANLNLLTAGKLIEQCDNIIRLTCRGMALENEVIVRLLSGT